MTRWELWQQDDGGNRLRLEVFTDRVEALARLLILQCDDTRGRDHWLDGPTEPVCRTNRDLYRRLVREGERMNAAGRSLDVFLRAWWRVSRPLSYRDTLDPDMVAAMVAAAATLEPAPVQDSWRSAAFDGENGSPYALWEAVVLSQIADLADFAERRPPDGDACYGVDAPRSRGCRRATPDRWYNFDPNGYLDCGMSGTLGGWSDDVEDRKTVGHLDWGDLAGLAECGQCYE